MLDNQESPSKELEQKGGWECFCDMAYFDKWAVRNKNDKAFNSTIHVETYDEAQDITDKFNELESTKQQFTTTQQSLDSAVAALKEIHDMALTDLHLLVKDASLGANRLAEIEEIAEAALASIKE